MKTIMTFGKNTALQNILFDEYFAEYCQVSIISFNYDGSGTTLCRCDGKLQKIDAANINKIIFGVSRKSLEDYLQNIFAPSPGQNSPPYQNGKLIFRIEELNKLKKYDVANLAKKLLKDLKMVTEEHIKYFTEQTSAEPQTGGCPTTLYGNAKSQVFHKSTCKSFSSISCTSLFNSRKEALSAGFKACRLCKP